MLLLLLYAGLVWRVAGETDSESDESEYEDEEDHVPAGCASVSWLRSGEVATPEVGRLRVSDRGLVTGDLVADASAPLGQVRRSSRGRGAMPGTRGGGLSALRGQLTCDRLS